MFYSVYDTALLAPTEIVVQLVLDTPVQKLEYLYLKIDVEKSCCTVFKDKT